MKIVSKTTLKLALSLCGAMQIASYANMLDIAETVLPIKYAQADSIVEKTEKILLALNTHQIYQQAQSRINNPWIPRVLKGHEAGINAIVLNRAGSQILTASHDFTARLWNRETGACLQIFKGHTDTVTCATFNHDESQIATASLDNTARIWDVKTGACRAALKGHTDKLRDVIYNHHGTQILTLSNDKTARVWNAQGVYQYTIQGPEKNFSAAAFTSDDSCIVTSTWDGSLYFWNATSGTFIKKMIPDATHIADAAVLNHDGSRLLTTSCVSNLVHVYDTATGACLQTIRELHSHPVTGSFNADSSQIIVTFTDSTRLFDIATGTLLMLIPTSAPSVCVIPHEINVITGHDDGTICMWDTAPSHLISHNELNLEQKLLLVVLETFLQNHPDSIVEGINLSDVAHEYAPITFDELRGILTSFGIEQERVIQHYHLITSEPVHQQEEPQTETLRDVFESAKSKGMFSSAFSWIKRHPIATATASLAVIGLIILRLCK